MKTYTFQDDDGEVMFKTPMDKAIPIPPTPVGAMDSTLFSPSALPELSQMESPKVTPRESLNAFLVSRDVSPIRTVMKTSWHAAADRTKRHYLRKARQVIHATLEEIAPESSEELLRAVQGSSMGGESDLDSTLLEALVECYHNADHWSNRRQILSIIADKVSFTTLQKWIPGISRYRFSIARHHRLLHGRGSEVPQRDITQTRMRASPEQLDHFLAFITSSKAIQDLPFGEKTLKLSSGAEIKIPKVIRTSVPEQIVKQYERYCAEIGYSSPLSRSSNLRILKVCSASMRKSLQGLDYFSADGAKAFDDLHEIVEKLGDRYQRGMPWSSEMSKKLKLAKRYLKGDYKVI